jgi:HlyD family secretion protein
VDALGERDFSARVRQIRLNPKIEQNVVTYNVVLSTRNDDGRLLPGMTANVSIEVARRDQALRVPNLALRFRPGEDAPVVDPLAGSGPATGSTGTERERPATLHLASEMEGRPVLVRQPVRLGISDGTLTELLWPSSLNQEDRVAVGEIVGGPADRRPAFRLRLF